MTAAPPRLSTPWRIVPLERGLAVEDASGLRLAYVPLEGQDTSAGTLTRHEALLLARGIASLPDLLSRPGAGAAAAPAAAAAAPLAPARSRRLGRRTRRVFRLALPVTVVAVVVLLLLDVVTGPGAVESGSTAWHRWIQRR